MKTDYLRDLLLCDIIDLYNMDQKQRQRVNKIFIGRAISRLPLSKGKLVLTVVAACSRQAALAKLQSKDIHCTKREFEKWACEEKRSEYSFIRKEGVWQTELVSPNKPNDYIEINVSDIKVSSIY